MNVYLRSIVPVREIGKSSYGISHFRGCLETEDGKRDLVIFRDAETFLNLVKCRAFVLNETGWMLTIPAGSALPWDLRVSEMLKDVQEVRREPTSRVDVPV